MNLKIASGLISAIGGMSGMTALIGFILFDVGAASTGALVLGTLGFFVLFMYGLEKALSEYYRVQREFQVNS